MDVPGNCGESESDKAIEDSEVLNFCFSSNSSKIYCRCSNYMTKWLAKQPMEDWQEVELALFAEYTIQGRGGVLDVIPGGKLMHINRSESEASKELARLLDGRDNGTGYGKHILNDSVEAVDVQQWMSDLEYNDSVVTEHVQQYRIWYTGGEVLVIPSWGALTFQGSELSDGQDLYTTPEPPLIFQEKSSIRLSQGNHGDWGVEFRLEWNWLNIGNEWVFRCRGGKDYIDFPFPELSPNRNREEPTTARITEIPTLALPSTTQQENPYEDFGLGCSEVTGNDGVEAVGIGSWNCCDSTTIQVVDEEGSPQLINSDNLPSDQAAAVTVDMNSVVGKEIPPLQFSRTAQQKNSDEAFGNDEVEEGGTEGQFDSRCSAKRKRKEMNPRRERRNKKTTGVRIGSPLVDNLQTKGRSLKNDAKRLKGVRLDENSCNDEVEAVGMGGVGTGEGEVKQGKLDCGSSDKGERNEKTPQGERANNKGKGVRTEIPLEEILKCKEMPRKAAAVCLQVSESTLKRICRGYNISKWSLRELNKLIGQSHPSESPSVVDQEQIRQSNFDTKLRSNQASIETNSVTVKAKYETVTIKFRLSRPWRKVELEENVKKRLGLEVGTYHTEYKDEDGELILISCDEDLKDCIPNSSPMGTCSIQLFLRDKVAHECPIDQL